MDWLCYGVVQSRIVVDGADVLLRAELAQELYSQLCFRKTFELSAT